MSINLSKETVGNYTLTREMWCDGRDYIKRNDGLDLDSNEDLFNELVRLEEKIRDLEGTNNNTTTA